MKKSCGRKASRQNQDCELGTYLDQIGQFPLLDLGTERLLAQQVEEGQEAEKIFLKTPKTDVVSKTQEALVAIIETGKKAREKLITHNLRLVVSIAKNYKDPSGYLTFFDFIQEGNKALMRAVEKFDRRLGCRLSTYATWAIRRAFKDVFDRQVKTIRITRHMTKQCKKFTNVKNQLIEELNRQPQPEEISKRMSVTQRQVNAIMQALLVKVTHSLETCTQIHPKALSYEHPWMDEEDNLEVLMEELKKLLQELPEDERIFIETKWGLLDGEERTYTAIGKILGRTREAIRLRAKKVLEKLRKGLEHKGYFY